ncbi:MAG: hypothetical protein R2932_17585 [Caldilineaceae bacterium]
MKIGVSSYSFIRLVKSGQMDQKAVIATAKEIGFDVIEFSQIVVPDGKTLPEYAGELRDEAKRIGIEIVNYAVSGTDFRCARTAISRQRLNELRKLLILPKFSASRACAMMCLVMAR